MTGLRLLRTSAPLWVLGLGVVGLWVWLAGGVALLGALSRVHPVALLAMAGVTLFWLAIRFLRWQFLLRRAGVRVPIRASLACYLAGLAGTATPAYIGELIRGVLLRRAFGAPFRLTTLVLVEERLLDVAALALVLGLTSGGWATGRFALLALLVVPAGWWLTRRIAARTGIGPQPLAAFTRAYTLVPAVILSLAAWSGAGLLLWLAASGSGIPLSPAASAKIFSASTLGGAATLLPAGIVSTGSLAILQLRQTGIGLTEAVALVSLMRLMSTGLCLALGAAFLAREVARPRTQSTALAQQHFDEIAKEYSAQFLPHVWNHLIERKLGYITGALPAGPVETKLGLDLGCGLGLQCVELRRRGYRVIGVDAAHQLLRHAGANGAPVATADALRLPFAAGTFDFVYTVGVLHHLPGPEAQESVRQEVLRVLKPGGAFVVHETNPRNPLFRFYMGYVFPVLKSIDEGTEWWIDPARWQGDARLRLEQVHYFTFLPDFLPAGLMRPFLALERWLEHTRARPYSVHYAAVMRREA